MVAPVDSSSVNAAFVSTEIVGASNAFVTDKIAAAAYWIVNDAKAVVAYESAVIVVAANVVIARDVMVAASFGALVAFVVDWVVVVVAVS